MEHKYYMPKDDLGRATWFDNFQEQLLVYASVLGLTTSETDAVTADANFFGFVVTLLPNFREYFKTLTTYKKELANGSAAPIGDFPAPPAVGTHTAVTSGVLKRTADLVQTIKKNPAYNQTMGQALGIIGEEIIIDLDAISPQVKGSIRSGHAYIKWNQETTEAGDVWADYDDGAGFVYVGRMIKPHYQDPHLPAVGQSKVYKFKVRYVLNNEPIGLPSAEVKLTVTGI